MRGAPATPLGAERRGRIIPADAGSTLGQVGLDGEAEDHPRGCGEHPGWIT